MIYFRIVYNSFFWALSLALTLFQNYWLQMRVNTGHIFLIAWPVLILLFIFIFRKNKQRFGLPFTIINVFVCCIYVLTLYGLQRIQIVPASILREGLHLGRIPFGTINAAVGIFILVGLLVVIYSSIRRKKA